jgi:acetylornithine deacetylase/succinyl-diaminopimelate desuccinylase-like protein
VSKRDRWFNHQNSVAGHMSGLESIDWDQLSEFVDGMWEDSALPSLSDFIRIPALSPAFDDDWAANGHLDATIDLFTGWLETIEMEGLKANVHRLAGRTPLLLCEVPGTGPGEVIFYSHLDKQPEFTGWSEGKGPWTPVREGEWLYGRGAIDDGYGGYSAMLSVMALKQQGIAHPTCRFLIETCEESGSPDLPFYLEELKEELGNPDLVIVLDSGMGDYKRFWITESLRGLVGGTLKVAVTSEGVHSGLGSGVIPSSFRIARLLLSRLEEAETGELLPEWLHIEISDQLRSDAGEIVAVLGDAIVSDFPLLDGVKAQHEDMTDALLAQNWMPTLSVTGADGMPPVSAAGNVLRTNTDLKLSVRIPPGVESVQASVRLKALLEDNPPFGAHVEFELDTPANGFSAPAMPSAFAEALKVASNRTFGNDAMPFYEGGTIPFLAMMQESYPDAHFLVTGCGGPGNNMHGPDEKLHVPTVKSVTQCVSAALAAMADR